MTDNKIEEATKMYAFHKCDEKDIDQYDLSYLLENAFKAGINWFLDNLWHDASEEPDGQESVLIEYNTPKGKSTFVRIIPFDWKFSIKNYNITRWLYIDDLLKGGNNG